jgi:myo-inositol-1-phosphate synthase
MASSVKEVRVFACGIGNCFKSFAEAVCAFTAKPASKDMDRGVLYADVGGYHVEHIKLVGGFDVDIRKIGKRLNEAIYELPNCAIDLCTREEVNSVEMGMVYPGPILDGVSPVMLAETNKSKTFLTYGEETIPLTKVQIIALLKELRVDVLVNYLPTGSQVATEFYVECALEAGVNVCNCIPVFIASTEIWEARFKEKGLLIIGDDYRSGVGASVLSAAIEELFAKRHSLIHRHVQINYGGNTDFKNLCGNRHASKKISKERVLTDPLQTMYPEEDHSDHYVFAGPACYIEPMGDQKVATFRIEGEGILGAPLILDMRLQVEDSPNSCAIGLLACRMLKVASEMGLVGSLRGASCFTQKSPPYPFLLFDDAIKEVEALTRRELTDNLRKYNLPA